MSDQNKSLTDRIELRPVVMPDDEEFLKALYATTRYDIERVPFSEAEKDAFLLMQYTAQKNHYDSYYDKASHDIVLYDGRQAGRYMVDSEGSEIIGVDLSLLPEFRSLGIGTVLLKGSFADAAATGRPFVFHVIKDNEKAIALYKRLGCKFTGETEMHYKMSWSAESGPVEEKEIKGE